MRKTIAQHTPFRPARKDLANVEDPLQALHQAGWMVEDAMEFSPHIVCVDR